MFGDDPKKAAVRATTAIHAYVGPNGSGKTLAAVHDTMVDLDAGRPALSTVPLRDWRAPCGNCGRTPCEVTCPAADRPPHPLWVPFESLEQLLSWRGGVILMDEVQGVASAREHTGLPYQVANLLRKLRHLDSLLRWTAPDWMAPDAVIRRVTKAVTLCEGSLPRTHYEPCELCGLRHRRPIKRECGGASQPKMWKDNRVMCWRTYDAQLMDEFTVAKAESNQKTVKLKPMVRQTYVRSKGSAQWAYDSFGEVISLGAADMAGVCISCGGTRSRKKCACPDHTATSPIRLVDYTRQSRVEPVKGAGRGPKAPTEPVTGDPDQADQTAAASAWRSLVATGRSLDPHSPTGS